MTLIVYLLASAARENSLYHPGGSMLVELTCGSEPGVFGTVYSMGLARNSFSVVFVTEGLVGDIFPNTIIGHWYFNL